MTKKELIESLWLFGDDEIVIIKDSQGGWSNIDYTDSNGVCINLYIEEFPVFSQN